MKTQALGKYLIKILAIFKVKVKVKMHIQVKFKVKVGNYLEVKIEKTN